jgi:hypothetical protein
MIEDAGHARGWRVALAGAGLDSGRQVFAAEIGAWFVRRQLVRSLVGSDPMARRRRQDLTESPRNRR